MDCLFTEGVVCPYEDVVGACSFCGEVEICAIPEYPILEDLFFYLEKED